MEMHQVRYFLAAATELNFTKAAERCNVSQPSLTRAIKQLEGELGGDLFRRERPQAQLTELGERMLPLLKQCYDSAIGARSLASTIKSGELGSLRLALSRAIAPDLSISHLLELKRLFQRLEVKLLRGTAGEVLQFLKKGEADLAIGSDMPEEWDRIDRWPLFTESLDLILSCKHPLAGRPSVDAEDIAHERLVRSSYCEHAENAAAVLAARNLDVRHGHEVTSPRDLIALVEAGFGIAVVPRSDVIPATIARTAVNGIDLRRSVYLYGVAGRERTAVASALLKLVRADDWSRYAS
jgi:DNA-binding transcriptional LysR family regulator